MTTIEEKDVIITRGKKRLVIRKPVSAPAPLEAPAPAPAPLEAPAPAPMKEEEPVQIQAPAVIQQAPAVMQAPNKIDQYISQLSAQEKIVFKIAQEHLESSFDMEKSIGYKEWLKNNKN